MRSLDSTFTEEKNAVENQPIRLYTIFDYDGSTDLHFAEYDTDITFDGVTYSRFPIKMGQVSENSQGTIDSVQIVLANVSRLIQSYLEDYDFRGKKVTIKTVFANQLADTGAYIDDIFYIDSYQASELSVTFTLTSKFDVLDITLPIRIYTRNYCGWKFKSTECGYDGAESTCNKTRTRCRVLANTLRFGGFPSINPNRTVLG